MSTIAGLNCRCALCSVLRCPKLSLTVSAVHSCVVVQSCSQLSVSSAAAVFNCSSCPQLCCGSKLLAAICFLWCSCLLRFQLLTAVLWFKAAHSYLFPLLQLSFAICCDTQMSITFCRRYSWIKKLVGLRMFQ